MWTSSGENRGALTKCQRASSELLTTHLPAHDGYSAILGTSRYASSAIAGRRGRLMDVLHPILSDGGNDTFAPPKGKSA